MKVFKSGQIFCSHLKVPLHKGVQVEDKVTWSANLKVTKFQLMGTIHATQYSLHTNIRLFLAAMRIAISWTANGKTLRMPRR